MIKWSGEYYIGKDFSEYYILFAKNRDSGLMVQSNFDEIIKILEEKNAKYIIAESSHWAVGWIEQILINEKDNESIDIANDIESELNNYPILNEDDYYKRVQERAETFREDFNRDLNRLQEEYGNDKATIQAKIKQWYNIDNFEDEDEINERLEILAED